MKTAKKVILLLLLILIMPSCKQYIKDVDGVVIGVKYKEEEFSGGFRSMYCITINSYFNGLWKCPVVLYTNKPYKIGDTIQIINKSEPYN